ncbi:histidine phosphatase family protein, partial [Litorisediminicola beolgyonensis]
MGVTLLRHTTPEVAAGTCYGRTDLALPQGFEAEADAALARLARPSEVISSPLTRCRRLAERAAARFGVRLRLVPGWIEMDFGRWEGRAWDAIPRAELDAWAADFHGFAGHGGESVAELAARISGALAAAPDAALVVTHAGCIKAALVAAGDPAGWDARPGFGEAR